MNNPAGTKGRLRAMVREALTAYELAIATNLRSEREARELHARQVASLDEKSKAAKDDLRRAQNEQVSAVSAEQARSAEVADAAEDVRRSAASLLERSALAHVLGLGPGPDAIDNVDGRPDERVASAFATAQMAAIELHAALLELAAVHLRSSQWEQARGILVPLAATAHGPLLDEVNQHLRRANLAGAKSALDAGEFEVARQRVEDWLKDHPADEPHFRELLHTACAELGARALAAGDFATARKLLATTTDRGQPADGAIDRVLERAPTLGWWGPGAPKRVAEFGGHMNQIQAVAFSADGRSVLSVDGTELKEWSVAEDGGRLVRTASEFQARMLSLNGRVSSGSNGNVWDVSSGLVIASIKGGHGERVSIDGFSPDGQFVLWSTIRATGTPVTFSRKRGSTGYWANWEARASYDERLMAQSQRFNPYATWGKEGPDYSPQTVEVRVRELSAFGVSDVASSAPLGVLNVKSHTSWLATAVSASGRLLASCDPFGEVVVAETASGQRIHTLSIYRQPLVVFSGSTTFSPGGALLLAVANMTNGKSCLSTWEVATGRLLYSREEAVKVNAVTPCPDGRLVGIGHEDGNIIVSELATGKPVKICKANGSPIRCLAFSPDGSRLTSGGDDRIVRLWGP